MRYRAWLAAAAILALIQGAAAADDEAECQAGIKAIKAALAAHPATDAQSSLQQSLKAAQQEVNEGDWFECVTIVRKAKASKK